MSHVVEVVERFSSEKKYQVFRFSNYWGIFSKKIALSGSFANPKDKKPLANKWARWRITHMKKYLRAWKIEIYHRTSFERAEKNKVKIVRPTAIHIASLARSCNLSRKLYTGQINHFNLSYRQITCLAQNCSLHFPRQIACFNSIQASEEMEKSACNTIKMFTIEKPSVSMSMELAISAVAQRSNWFANIGEVK